MKFYADWHFIYIIAWVDEHKDQLHSYYKLTEEYLEEITKDWSIDLLIPTDLAEMSNLDSLETTHKEHDTCGPSRMKKTEEFQDLISASGKTSSVSLDRGGDDKVEELTKKGSK
jgi:hypothetical protein